MEQNDNSAPSQPTPLALPPPPPEVQPEQLAVNSSQTFKFDNLGPVVVNRDGTLSRISNWENMTQFEKDRTVRVLVARNQVRLAQQEQETGAEVLSISKQATS